MIRLLLNCLTCLFFVCLANSEQKNELALKLKQISQIVCVDNLYPDKLNITIECEEKVPLIFRTTYLNCIRQTMGITDIKLPFICYRYIPGGELIKECLDKRAKIGTLLGIDMVALRIKVLTNFANCLKDIQDD